MSDGYILLREVASHTDMLEVACTKCERRGRVSLERLIAEHGPMRPVASLREQLAGDCERMQQTNPYDRCDTYFPNLPAFFKPSD
jgi:hypothetical protein